MIALFAALVLGLSPQAAPEAPTGPQPRIVARPTAIVGRSPEIVLEGLRPEETVRLHALRRSSRVVQRADGTWGEEIVTLHAFADFRAGAEGRVAVDAARPLVGSWREADGRAPFWSGYPRGAPELQAVGPESLYDFPRSAPGTTWLSLARGQEVVARATTRTLAEAPDTRLTTVAEGPVSGVFAAPAGLRRGPTVIVLHGSEGGDYGRGRAAAARFAAEGYAAFAFNYFAFGYAPLPGVPEGHVDIPIEVLDQVRAWLARQAEVDPERIAVVGWSKGAEFAEVAAVRLPWIRAIVACVPTDIVWEGYGRDAGAGTARSSWSWRGAPLPFMALDPWRDDAGYRTNTDRYDRSRASRPEQVGPAVIPLETTSARVLLLAGDRDEVWNSAIMSRALTERFRRAGRASQVETRIYPAAGHMICGDGVFPARLYNTQRPEPWAKDVTAEGHASVDAWARQLDFLRRTIGPGMIDAGARGDS